jgi:hypothetical protein
MAAEAPSWTWKERLMSRQTWYAVAAGLALGAVASGLWWRVRLVPQQAAREKRYRSTLAIAQMYGL